MSAPNRPINIVLQCGVAFPSSHTMTFKYMFLSLITTRSRRKHISESSNITQPTQLITALIYFVMTSIFYGTRVDRAYDKTKKYHFQPTHFAQVIQPEDELIQIDRQIDNFTFHSVTFLVIQLFSMAEPFIHLIHIIHTQDIFIYICTKIKIDKIGKMIKYV